MTMKINNITKNKKLVSTAAAIILTCLVCAALINNGLKKIPDLSDKTPEQAMKFFQSDKFREMSREDKRRTHRQFFRQQITKTADEYYNLPEDQKKEYLDNLIDRIQMMRQRRQQRHASDGTEREQNHQRRGGRRNRSPERFRQRVERVPPETRAKMTKLMQDMHQRMQERGMVP